MALLADAGVSVWLDDLGRNVSPAGRCASWCRPAHVTGVTSNPSIFHKSIGAGADYADELRVLAADDATAERPSVS